MTQAETQSGLTVGEGDVLAVAGDAVTVEGAAHQETGLHSARDVVVWLFQPDHPPRQVNPEDVPALITVEDNLVWIDLSGYAEDDLAAIVSLASVPHRVAASVRGAWERPQLQLCGAYFAVNVTVPDVDLAQRRVVARQLDLVLGHNCLISAHKQPLPFYQSLLARAGTDPDLVRLDSGFMLYIVLDELLEYYEKVQEQIRGEIEHLQAHALRDSSDAFLEDILQFKRFSFALTHLAQQHESLFGALLRPDFPFLSAPEVLDHFRALENRLLRLNDRLEADRQEVNNTFDILLSHQSHRTNNIMRILTVVATVLFTGTFIEGIFSPNFGGVPTHTAGAFAVMLVLLALAVGIELVAFRRWGWL